MTPDQIHSIGFIAQGLFASRFIVQWLKSEKVGRVITPVLFWQISLVASFLLIIYSILAQDLPVLLGQAIGYYIYVRNLRLKRAWRILPKYFRYFVIAFPFMAGLWLIFGGQYSLKGIWDHHDNMTLLIWGTIGQLIFSSRFIYQWFYSEKIKRSVLPLGFWLISIVGALFISVYAFYMELYPIIMGHVFGLFIYTRNIVIHFKYKKKLAGLKNPQA